MPRITSIEPGFYRIPLPTVLTDSMHGEMRAFELNTVRIRDADGAEAVADFIGHCEVLVFAGCVAEFDH